LPWLEEAAEEVGRGLNAVLALYALHSRELYEKLKPLREVDVEKAEELAEARYKELSKYSDAGMGTKAYAALLSISRGGLYGHAATLLMMEGALADIVLSTPRSAYQKADRIAERRGEAVDPSRSPKGAVNWEDRAASALMRYLLGRAVNEDLMFRRIKGGFKVFRAYGGVEARVDVLRIWETAVLSKASEEELRRLVEEAKRTAPDLSGIKKIWQTLEWFATDVSFDKGRIVAGTAHLWQAAWYIALFGEPEPSRGRTNVTEKGVKPYVQMRWRREVLDRIIAEEGEELKPLLGTAQRVAQKHGGGRAVKSWRELVDAIDWSWVLKKVEELADKLKPWIGSKKTGNAEREGLVRRMLGELALFVHFAEARRGLGDDEWREERVKRLAKAVEALSGGRIAGDDAKELARLIIYYAEGKKTYAEKHINELAERLAGVFKEDVERVKGEVWGVVEFVLSDMYCLARDCARDEVVRKFVAPALELMMLDKALYNEFDREKALLIFGEMYATALAGDGTVGPDMVKLTVGGELGGGAALLRLATLHLLNRLLPDELRFNAWIYVGEGRYYDIAASGKNAARFMRLLAVSAPSASGEYLSDKFKKFVEAAKVEVRLDKNSIRLTRKGRVAADLIISVGGAAVKYNVYLHDEVELQFASTDRSRVELAARLLRLAGVSAEVKKVGDRDVWRVVATTDTLAAGREELRNAIAEVVKTAHKSVDEKRAELWLKKLKEGFTLREGWPKYHVGLSSGGALVISFSSTNLDSIKQEVQRLKEMGLEEGKHFSVKMPVGGEAGYVSILKEGLAYAAWLSVRGKDEEQRELAAEFVELILKRAEEACGGAEQCAVYEKAKEIIEEGRARGSLELNFEKWVEVNGKTYFVKVTGGEAVEEKQNGKILLRIKITAEVGRVEGEHIVDRVVREYTITYSRHARSNAAVGRAYARADAPGGKEADAERFAALIKALTGREPKVYHMKNGQIMIECYEGHLEGFMRYAELADTIERWLKETGRR
jgi:hypothetical protein